MWGNSRKRKTTKIDTLIGQQTEVLGDIRFVGGLHIDNRVKGDVTADNDSRSTLSLSEQGTIEGEIKVPHAFLNGAVIGDVRSSEHIELSSKARITGDIYYNLLEIATGAEVNGKLIHVPNGNEEVSAIVDNDSLA